MKILLVDDSKFSREKIKSMLIDKNFEIIEAEDGMDGLIKYKEFQPNIIITDYDMPKMNGLDISKKILSLNPKANIILVTSIADKRVFIEALKTVKAVLPKPLTKEDLLNEIQKLEV